jgi:hypothetical protein
MGLTGVGEEFFTIVSVPTGGELLNDDKLIICSANATNLLQSCKDSRSGRDAPGSGWDAGYLRSRGFCPTLNGWSKRHVSQQLVVGR